MMIEPADQAKVGEVAVLLRTTAEVDQEMRNGALTMVVDMAEVQTKQKRAQTMEEDSKTIEELVQTMVDEVQTI